jgi:hypothetical protein
MRRNSGARLLEGDIVIRWLARWLPRWKVARPLAFALVAPRLTKGIHEFFGQPRAANFALRNLEILRATAPTERGLRDWCAAVLAQIGKRTAAAGAERTG